MKKLLALMLSLALMFGAVQTGYVYAAETEDKKTEDTAPDGAEDAADNENDENAENAENAENEEDAQIPKVLELSMEDAIKYMKENSRDMMEIELKIKEAKTDRVTAGQTKNASKETLKESLERGITLGASMYLDALLAKNDYVTKAADIKIEMLEKSKSTVDATLEMAALRGYYGLLLAEEQIVICESSLAQAEQQLNVINVKFENGSATRADVLRAEQEVQKAKSDIDSSVDSLKMSQLEYLSVLGLPLDTEIVLTDKELEYVPTGELDLDASIERAFNDRTEIANAINGLELQKIYTQAVKTYYTANLAIYKRAEKDLEDAELAIPDAYEAVELDIRQKYQSLVESERAIINADQLLVLAEEGLRVSTLLYDNGMATSLEVMNANTVLTQAKISRYTKLIQYNINKLLFDRSNVLGNAGYTDPGEE